uniref:Uncharacterized protein n=1 Tax=Picea glauca TaxID=3330 RepID=A0A101LZK9_PICGL|nr:hypothetical protein ABT39_MTgene5247 [Picea glauca]
MIPPIPPGIADILGSCKDRGIYYYWGLRSNNRASHNRGASSRLS